MINDAGTSQKGLSLIELMIAITLGLIIVAAMISLYVNAQESYRINENMSRLQENARFAVSFITRDIRMADYRECPNRSVSHLSDAVSGQDGQTGDDPDTVTIVYQSNICNTALARVTKIYSIRTGQSGNPALFRSTNGGDPEELVEGIENLQILYGEDTDGNIVPNHFVNAAGVTDMANVTSIRFTLTARTLGTNITSSGGRLTREFTSTVTLRNRLS